MTILSVASPSSAGQVYGFGDSLLDDGTILRTTGSTADAATGSTFSGINFSNGPTAFDYFGNLTGLGADVSNNHAVAGVYSGLNSDSIGAYPGTLAQVQTFVASGARFSPHDIAIVDGGTNELGSVNNASFGVPNGLTVPLTLAAAASYVGSNDRNIFSLLAGAGLKTLIVYDVPSTDAGPINDQIEQAAAAASGHGLNVHEFDLLGLYLKVAQDPGLYGFVSGNSCNATPACVSDHLSVENQYFTIDGVHPTTAGHDLIARYLAAQYEAPQAIVPQSALAEASAITFSQTLMSRLSSLRMTPAAATATDMLGAPVTLPYGLTPVSVFASGIYAGGSAAASGSASGPAIPGFDYGFAGMTAGAEAQPDPSLRVGSAFSYLTTSVRPKNAYSAGRTDLQAFQGSVYASYTGPHLFVDEVVTYGFDWFHTSRSGVVSSVSATPLGATASSDTKVGYLFDFGTVQAGPLARLTYAHSFIGGYRETGDNLLTLQVSQQSTDALTGASGVELRARTLMWPWLSASLDLTADSDLIGNGRTLTTAQSYATDVLIRTAIGDTTDRLYGHVDGTLRAAIGSGLDAELSGFSSFARSGGNFYGVDPRLVYRF